VADPDRFGDPRTMERLADAVVQTATALDQLAGLLNSDVESVVPDRWNAPAASRLEGWWRWMRDDVLKLTRNVATQWAAELRAAGESFRAAREIFEQARSFARTYNLVIRDDLVVVALSQSDPRAEALVAVAQNMVRAAWETAENARQRLLDANQKAKEGIEAADEILVSMIESLSAGPDRGPRVGRGRPGPTLGITPRRPVAARRGHEVHEMLRRTEQPLEGQLLRRGWQVMGIERRFGGDGRVDAAYINHQTRQILVVDYFTGPVEPLSHAQKTHNYRNLPDIQALIRQGYEFIPTTAMWRSQH
jgi:hypothetical protein